MDNKKLSYVDKIIEVFKKYGEYLDIDEIMQHMNVENTKLTYIIYAIKKLISNGIIIKITNTTEKRLFLGHKYKLII